MHPLLDVKPWPRVLRQYPLLILSAALLGGLGAFAYSYAPLHRAKDWQIDYLESRLESRNQQVESLEEKLRDAQASMDGKPSGEELGALRGKLDEVTKHSSSLEKQVRELEQQLEQVTRSRDGWKQKHAAALREIESVKAAAAATPDEPVAAASPQRDADDAGSPAAPAPVAGGTTPEAAGAPHASAPDALE